MSDLKITCTRCKQQLDHQCGTDLVEALTSLFSWVPTPAYNGTEVPDVLRAESEKQGDDFDFEKTEFFGSQGWSYLLFHKEDARTFHALLNQVARAAGLDPGAMKQEIYQKREAVEKEAAERRRRGIIGGILARKRITTEEQHAIALAEVERLVVKDLPITTTGGERLSRLATIVETYEKGKGES